MRGNSDAPRSATANCGCTNIHNYLKQENTPLSRFDDDDSRESALATEHLSERSTKMFAKCDGVRNNSGE